MNKKEDHIGFPVPEQVGNGTIMRPQTGTIDSKEEMEGNDTDSSQAPCRIKIR